MLDCLHAFFVNVMLLLSVCAYCSYRNWMFFCTNFLYFYFIGCSLFRNLYSAQILIFSASLQFANFVCDVIVHFVEKNYK